MVFKPYLVLKRTQFGKIKESHPEVGRWVAESVLDSRNPSFSYCLYWVKQSKNQFTQQASNTSANF
jgi:hypothetical protein